MNGATVSTLESSTTKRSYAFSRLRMEANRRGLLLDGALPANEKPLTGSELPWRDWLTRYFPHVASSAPAERHIRLWEWFESITPGQSMPPAVEVWARGGAKSSSAELGCARLCVKLSARYVLYVCGTQEQADKHVSSIASLLEHIGVERQLNKYGNSRGWRRDVLKTANGYNVQGIGLDTAIRGVKLDQYRPDLIVFDDIDDQSDTPRTVDKKIAAITTAIIPAGAAHCNILCVQNLIHEDSVFAQLADGRADFLLTRLPARIEPAAHNLTYESIDRGDGLKQYRVTGGEPTWCGQDLATIERQMNDWGLSAFLREAQHEVAGADGYFFNTSALNYIDASDLPPLTAKCRAWDLAATENGGDWTAGALVGIAANKCLYVLYIRHVQYASDKVRNLLTETAKMDGPGVALHLPQDPGQAGKDQSAQLRQLLAAYRPKIESVSGSKDVRARAFADAVNAGNVYVVRAEWNAAMVTELRKFREDLTHEHDDMVDALSDATNELCGRRERRFW